MSAKPTGSNETVKLFPADAVAAAFNEWMRRYTEDPEQFTWEWQTTTNFLSQQNAGETPTYGAICAAYLDELIGEMKKRPRRHGD